MLTSHEVSRAIERATESIAAGETSIGDALRREFPSATTGDEAPGMAEELGAAVRRYMREWAELNLGTPSLDAIERAVEAIVETATRGENIRASGTGRLFAAYLMPDGRVQIEIDHGDHSSATVVQGRGQSEYTELDLPSLSVETLIDELTRAKRDVETVPAAAEWIRSIRAELNRRAAA